MLGKYGIGFGKVTTLLLTQSTMGLQPVATFLNCVYATKFSEMVQAVVTFPRAARKPANNKRCGPLS
jgi:hypothetical protein